MSESPNNLSSVISVGKKNPLSYQANTHMDFIFSSVDRYYLSFIFKKAKRETSAANLSVKLLG